MGYKVKDEQVVRMSRLHTNTFIATRLDISARQVSRILKKHAASKNSPARRCRTMDPDVEQTMMEFSRETFGESLAKIGYRFGLSRQAVHQRLTDN